MDYRTTMHANRFWTIFQEKYVCQHDWKVLRNPFTCMDVLRSMWKGPNHCKIFMESGSESATYVLGKKIPLLRVELSSKYNCDLVKVM